MKKDYILAADQSTQGTKGLLFDANGALVSRVTVPHKQYVSAQGWVEHDPCEILANTLTALRGAVEKADVDPARIAALGISNQRETVMAWSAATGRPLYRAIVWQCARAREICAQLADAAAAVKAASGLPLSPYFSAAKLAWLLRNVPAVRQAADDGSLRCGTMDSWLVWNLSAEKAFKTDFSNASRTQLFNIRTLGWDEELCRLFAVPRASLAQVCMSDSVFGHTTLGGWLKEPIPICGVLGDSHGALLGQHCLQRGDIKATYGTGSSVMMQTGEQPVDSKELAVSLAWGLSGKVSYVLEGNINYTGAVITWLKENVGLIAKDAECEALARAANPQDRTVFVPAFTGLGAPYWDSGASALLTGVTRTTGRAEIVKACVDCIAYQVADLVAQMSRDAGLPVRELRADGGPTANAYLMQFQSDIAGAAVSVPALQELSGLGAALAAGLSTGLCRPDDVCSRIARTAYSCKMAPEQRQAAQARWRAAVNQALTHA